MKLTRIVTGIAFLLATFGSSAPVSAVTCTKADNEEIFAVEATTISKACPSLYISQELLQPLQTNEITTAALRALAPCKMSACTSTLKKMAEAVPDCSNLTINPKTLFASFYKLCSAFAVGDVTIADAQKIFADFEKTKSSTSTLDDPLGIKCTEDEIDLIDNFESGSMHTSCPTLYGSAGDFLVPINTNDLTVEALRVLAPCKNDLCVVALKKMVKAVPDCVNERGVSPATWFGATLKLCEAFAVGSVTVADAKKILAPRAGPTSNLQPESEEPPPNSTTNSAASAEPTTTTTETPITPETSSTGPASTSSTTVVIVAVVGGLLVLILLAVAVFLWRRRARRDKLDTPAAQHDYLDMTQSTTTDVPRAQFGDFPEGRALAQYVVPHRDIKFERAVSQGGFGEVWRGVYKDQMVAVKRLLASRRNDMHSIRGFVKEIQLTASLNHECLVKFIGVAWDEPANLCMITEFMKGGDLRMLLANYTKSGHANGHDDEKLRIAVQVAHALTYLHSRNPPVVHRDLKSRNILLTEFMDAKVIDFGISCERQDVTMTAGVGTSLWMAPEVMLGERYDEKADVFSFGVILSELDTQELPYDHARDPTSNRKMADMVLMQMITEGKLKPRFTAAADPQMVALARDCLEVDAARRPAAWMVLSRIHARLRNDPTLSVQTRTAIHSSSSWVGIRPAHR